MLDKLAEFVAEPLPRKILFFDDMLTPSLIRAVYWLGLLSVVWTGLGRMFSNGFFGFFEGIVYIVIGVIVLRVISELVMLLFKINENVEALANGNGDENVNEPKASSPEPATKSPKPAKSSPKPAKSSPKPEKSSPKPAKKQP